MAPAVFTSVLPTAHSLYLIPGSAAQLSRVHVHEDNILLVYKDARARMWNAKTREFWRSMTLDKAEEFINQGGWLISYVNHDFDCQSSEPNLLLFQPDRVWRKTTAIHVIAPRRGPRAGARFRSAYSFLEISLLMTSSIFCLVGL